MSFTHNGSGKKEIKIAGNVTESSKCEKLLGIKD